MMMSAEMSVIDCVDKWMVVDDDECRMTVLIRGWLWMMMSA